MGQKYFMVSSSCNILGFGCIVKQCMYVCLVNIFFFETDRK